MMESSRSRRVLEWSASLGHWTAAVLVFLTVTGLWVWLGPFAIHTQVSLIAHTLVGLVTVPLIVTYLIRHWWIYRDYALNSIKLLGYLALVGWSICTVTGVGLTYQSLVDIRIRESWRSVHQWSTIGLLVFVVPHVVALVWRDLAHSEHGCSDDVRGSVQGYLRHTAVGAVVSCLLVAGAALIYQPPSMITEFAADYDLWKPKSAQYDKNRPFAPSMATTKDGRPIDAKALSGSKGCGTAGCHEQIVEEWLPSAHRYAAMDKAFQAIQLTMAKQNGPTSTRYCGGCHDPISLFSGTKNIFADEKKLTGLPGHQEGISCLSCHAIKETDIKGNAHFVIAQPPRYIGEIEFDEGQGAMWRNVRDFLIRAYPDAHVKALTKSMFKKPEYCAACHKQFIDEEINKVGWVQLQNQYDNWRMSRWARGIKDPKKILECRECHMPLIDSRDPASGDANDYNRSPSDRKHRSHRFIGANQQMPTLLKLEGAAEQVDLTHKWLQGKIKIPEIASKWAPAEVPAVSLELIVPAVVRTGDKVTIRCVVTSNKVGHDFPTGPLDIIQAWLEVVVADENGSRILESGLVDAKGFIKPDAFIFKAEPVDHAGNVIDRHNLWEMVGVRSRRSLFPGFADATEFRFMCPEVAPRKRPPERDEKLIPFEPRKPGTLRVTGRLRYRKIDQFLLNFIRTVGFFDDYKGQELTSPITDMHVVEQVIQVKPSLARSVGSTATTTTPATPAPPPVPGR